MYITIKKIFSMILVEQPQFGQNLVECNFNRFKRLMNCIATKVDQNDV